MVKELEKAAFEFEKLHGEKIYLEVEGREGCKHLCIESFKAGANYANSLNEEVVNELTSEIDWENRRYELAKAAIAGLYSKEDEGDISKMRVGASKDLLLVVDELIKQLRQSNEAK